MIKNCIVNIIRLKLNPTSVLSLYTLRLIYYSYTNIDFEKFDIMKTKTLSLLRNLLESYNECLIDCIIFLY